MKYQYNDIINSEINHLNNSIYDTKFSPIKNKRNSSIELLRIILITLIVFHHIFVNTDELIKLDSNNYQKLICYKYILLKIISNYGQFGNNVFIMISGYFSVSKTNFNIHKFFYFLFEIYTYYYPSLYFGNKLSKIYKNLKFPNYSNKEIFFPLLSSNGNWFIQVYLLLLIFNPFINIGLLNLNHQKYKNLVKLIILFYCIFCPLIDFFNFNSFIFQTTPLIKLLLSYIIGGYIKIYDLKYKYIWKIVGIFYFPFTIFLEIIFDLQSIFHKNYNIIIFYQNISYNMNSFFSIVGSMGLIFLFKNFNFYNKKLNWLASSILGIYLIHGNKNISPYIYNIWIKTNNYNDFYFFIKYILKGILIIILCLFIDIIRRYTIGLLINNLIKKLINLNLF